MKIKINNFPELFKKSVAIVLSLMIGFGPGSITSAWASSTSPSLLDPDDTQSRSRNWLSDNSMDTNFQNELVLKIFSFISPQDLLVGSRVCKLWKRLADDQTLWKTHALDLADLDEEAPPFVYKKMVIEHLKLKSLSNIFADNIQPPCWQQAVETFVSEKGDGNLYSSDPHKTKGPQHKKGVTLEKIEDLHLEAILKGLKYKRLDTSDPQYEERVKNVRNYLGISSDLATDLDKVEEMHLGSIIKDLNVFLTFLSPARATFKPEAIEILQDALIPQVYRLARFRADQGCHYFQLAEAMETRSLPEYCGPVNMTFELSKISKEKFSDDSDSREEMIKFIKAWSNYIINTYKLNSNVDGALIVGTILSNVPAISRLRDQVEYHFSQPHWRRLEYLYRQKVLEPSPLLESSPYLTLLPIFDRKAAYAVLLEELIISGVLTTSIIPETASSLAKKVKKTIADIKKIFIYCKAEEYIRVLLSPVESLVNSPIGKEPLTLEEEEYALNQLYLIGAGVVYGSVPKIYLQAGTSKETKNYLDLLYQLIPFKDLRNMGLIMHHANFLKRPQDRKIVSEHLPEIVNALRSFIPFIRKLIEVEVGIGAEKQHSRNILKALKSDLAPALGVLRKIGSYGLDVSTLYKIVNCVGDHFLHKVRTKSSGTWSATYRKSFIRLLSILGESTKNLSERVRNKIGNDLVWGALDDLRDEVIVHGSKLKLETFLTTPENGDAVKKALEEIITIRGRAKTLFKLSSFTLTTFPYLPLLDQSFGQHLKNLLDSVLAIQTPSFSSGDDQSKVDSYAPRYAPPQEENIEELRETLNRSESNIRERIKRVESALLTSVSISSQVNDDIELLPFSRRERGDIQAVFEQIESLKAEIRAATKLIDKAFTDKLISESQFNELVNFFNSNILLEAEFIEKIRKMVEDLPSEEDEGDKEEDNEEEESDGFFTGFKDHPLVKAVNDFILEKEEEGKTLTTKQVYFENKLQKALNVISHFDLEIQFQKLVEITFAEKEREETEKGKVKTEGSNISKKQEVRSNEEKENAEIEKYLKKATKEKEFEKAEENEKKALDILSKRLEPFGITSIEDLDIWIQNLKSHHGFYLQPENMIFNDLTRAKYFVEVLLTKFNDLDDLTQEMRRGKKTEVVEKFWANKPLCLALEDCFEALRHSVGSIEVAIRYMRTSNPSLAAVVETQINAFMMLGIYLGHTLDTSAFETRTEKGRQYELVEVLNTIFGNLKTEGSLSFVDALTFFSNYCTEFLDTQLSNLKEDKNIEIYKEF